jgi:hypothetical protein
MLFAPVSVLTREPASLLTNVGVAVASPPEEPPLPEAALVILLAPAPEPDPTPEVMTVTWDMVTEETSGVSEGEASLDVVTGSVGLPLSLLPLLLPDPPFWSAGGASPPLPLSLPEPFTGGAFPFPLPLPEVSLWVGGGGEPPLLLTPVGVGGRGLLPGVLSAGGAGDDCAGGAADDWAGGEGDDSAGGKGDD